MKNVCLADFIAEYKKGSGERKINENEDEDSFNVNLYRSRNKPAIIDNRRYKLVQDAHYYQEQIMLFLPWRNEADELEYANCENKHFRHLDSITRNRAKYSVLGDEE